jgi:hypothetical protein
VVETSEALAGAAPSEDEQVGIYALKASDRLDLLTLPARKSDDLLRLLRRHEITRHHLMPDLANAARGLPSGEATGLENACAEGR